MAHNPPNIHQAAREGGLPAVKRCLAAGVHVDVTDEQQCTALYWAATNGHVRIVQHLLDNGAGINKKNWEDKQTALYVASFNGHLPVVRVLVDHGADLECKTSGGFTAFVAAAQQGQLDVETFLADKGADVDARAPTGHNATHYAVQNGHLNVIKFLDERGCDMNATTNIGDTSLAIVAENARIETMDYLLSKGVDVNIVNNYGYSALHRVCESTEYKNATDRLTAAELLVKHGARVDGRNKDGKTPADLVQDNDQLKQFLQHAAKRTPQRSVSKTTEPSASASAAKLTGRVQHLHLEQEVEVYKPVHPNIKCVIDKLCCEYVSSLQLSADFFDPNGDQCFCLHCHHERGDADSYPRGQPPQTYALPVGWTRFGLRLPPRAKHLGAIPKWHRAYHGTRADSIEGILSTDLLAPPGSEVLGGANIKELPGHFDDDWKPKGFDTKQIFLSPSPKYAQRYAPITSFTASNKKIYQVRVALSVLVDPRSYKVGPETMGFRKNGELCDQRFSNDKLEWATKQLGAVMFSGLLVKIE